MFTRSDAKNMFCCISCDFPNILVEMFVVIFSNSVHLENADVPYQERMVEATEHFGWRMRRSQASGWFIRMCIATVFPVHSRLPRSFQNRCSKSFYMCDPRIYRVERRDNRRSMHPLISTLNALDINRHRKQSWTYEREIGELNEWLKAQCKIF